MRIEATGQQVIPAPKRSLRHAVCTVRRRTEHYSPHFAQQDTRKRELPGDLRRLLPYHKGKDYRVVGNDIVLIEIATELILDVMKDVLR